MGKLTYNTKLVFQSESDSQKIVEMLESQRFAWNECSKVKFAHVPKTLSLSCMVNFIRIFVRINLKFLVR